MIPSQMLKGTLEGCVLAIISKEETYGYEISEQLMEYGFGKITEGTIYPLLLRLEKNELISATYKASELGPRRKYYKLTEKGNDALEDFFQSYRELSDAVNHLMRDMQGGIQK
ncbi:PadR family transcriptional regulator [Ruminococcus sp. CLA-AA-H200]|uniref:PadR family transcriptional regulator n=1 Tax=Ruminococcus turbiniformis TaxID=2881258 RepID=A0ABS8FXS8_9FIRM|nr:PadR family transcriptional regulator [Ruminococcus turbiniformis]MCC2254783.1 PadR family transcriptional regulator [Ruminococcus turbiniformis]